MIKAGIKKIIILSVVAVLLIIPSAVFAASSDYSFVVPKTSDKESEELRKSYDESAENKVNSINGALGSWVEIAGVNCTYKVYYDTTGIKQMDYRPSGSTSEYIGSYLKLNVSTALSQLTSVTTSGKWSPDEL